MCVMLFCGVGAILHSLSVYAEMNTRVGYVLVLCYVITNVLRLGMQIKTDTHCVARSREKSSTMRASVEYHNIIMNTSRCRACSVYERDAFTRTLPSCAHRSGG